MIPLLVVVTGPPGSGKTTLARAIAAARGLPLYTKDDLKRVLYDTLGWGGRERDREVGAAALGLLEHLVRTELAAARSLAVESNFREVSASWLARAATDAGAAIVQIRCTAARDVLEARVRARAADPGRHPGYADGEWLETEADAVFASGAWLDLDGARLEIDTGRWPAGHCLPRALQVIDRAASPPVPR